MKKYWQILTRALISLSFIFSGFGLVLVYKKFRSDMSGYFEIKLDATLSEALYTFGVPDYVLGDKADAISGEMHYSRLYRVDGSDEENKIPDGKTFKDFSDWIYGSEDLKLNIGVSPVAGVVDYVSCISFSTGGCPKIFGITTGMSEDAIFQILGEPTKVRLSGITKELIYDGLGLEVYLTKRIVYKIVKRRAVSDVNYSQMVRIFVSYLAF